MKSVKLEILTPHSMFFSGEVESLTVETPDGSEGYLHGHIWCRKLLKENSKVSIPQLTSSSWIEPQVKIFIAPSSKRYVHTCVTVPMMWCE